MTHISEDEFQESVENYLIRLFDIQDVYVEQTLPSGRRPDFIVRNAFINLAIEVENEASATYESVGQALAYAEELEEEEEGEEFEPVVIVPIHQTPENVYLTEHVTYKEVSANIK